MIHLITGGERSGKSSYAEKMALSISENPMYIATARNWDGDFQKRIQRHQQNRSENWINIEEEKFVSKLNLDNQVMVIDCITLWLTNFFVDLKYDIQACLEVFKKEINAIQEFPNTKIFIITNEIGMGVHAEHEVSRKFVELHGWANQYVASVANEVTLMVSGIPLKVK